MMFIHAQVRREESMLHIALLGRYDVHLDDEPLELNLRPARLLLAYLLFEAWKKTSAGSSLPGILWPDYNRRQRP